MRKITQTGVRSSFAFLAMAAAVLSPAAADTKITPIDTQYIAALGPVTAHSGNDAETWGLWPVDPGPRGVRLSAYEALKANGGVAPSNWTFSAADWWLEEHGLIMEQPVFPLAPGRYVVTGGRQYTSILTIHPKAVDGHMKWELDTDAVLYDVTHLRCRAARYTPATNGACSPEQAKQEDFPVQPGAAMPAVGACQKQDYQVLIVTGMVTEG
jgi:hypothetical protein